MFTKVESGIQQPFCSRVALRTGKIVGNWQQPGQKIKGAGEKIGISSAAITFSYFFKDAPLRGERVFYS